jgi:ABC-type Fe3+ transport system permease subunit
MTSDKIFAIALMFLIPFVSVLIPILLGQWYGQYRKKKTEEVQHAPVGSVVGAAFGLLAFMLAITFQIAANRYERATCGPA